MALPIKPINLSKDLCLSHHTMTGRRLGSLLSLGINYAPFI